MGILRLLFRAFWSAPKARPYVQPYEAEAETRRVILPVNVTVVPKRKIMRGTCFVVDGDTIIIDRCNIRLAGIDAPELDHPWGNKAKWALYQLCKGQVVTAEVTGDLSYDRLVAICRLPDGRDLSAEMVKMGLALDWRKHSGGQYRSLEPDGVRKKLWRADARQKGRFPPNGDFSSSGQPR
jgi:micrococcal nuclease